jgi:hypothetical protein
MMTNCVWLPDPEAARAAHARLSTQCRASFYSPLKISAEVERTADKGEAEFRVLTALTDGGDLTVNDIREECDMGRDAARATLSLLIQQGKVEVLTSMYGHKTYRLRGSIPQATVGLSHRSRPRAGTRMAQVLEAAEAQPGSFMVECIMRATGIPFARTQNFIGLLIQQGWLRRLSLIGRGRPGIYEVIK